MKKYISLIFMLCSISGCLSQTKNSAHEPRKNSITGDSTFRKLSNIDTQKYEGATIEYFLKNEKLENYKNVAFYTEPSCYLSKVRLFYSDNETQALDIEIDHNMLFTQRLNINSNWDFKTVKKEKIISIVLVK